VPLAQLLQITLPELERLLNGDQVPAAPNGHVVPTWLSHYASLEQGAARLQSFDPITLPGLLQTAAYAEAVMRTHWVDLTDAVVHERVASRLARQVVLDRAPNPLEFCCIIDESVLYRETGGADVMAEQLDHLLALAQSPTIHLQISPSDSSAVHMASFGSFDLFTSEGATVPYMVCTEDLTGFNYLDRPPAIEAHIELFDHLSRTALTPIQSAELLQRTRTERYR
jgi:hypothetical protein